MPAPPVLFPTSDEAVALLSKYESELAGCSRFVLPERETLLDILNKDRTERLARKHGVPIPPTRLLSSLPELRAAAAEMRFPVLFKPRNHYSVCLPGSAKNLTFRSPGEMTALFALHPHLVPLGVFQEIIPGGDGHILVCAGYFDRDSKPLAVYTGRKVRQLQPDFGVTSYGISEPLPEVAELTVSFLGRIGFCGLVAVEYARHRETGEVYFLEINPRAYYHNALFLACGVNLAWIAYLDAVGHPLLSREVHPAQKYGVRWLDLARDTRSFLIKHRGGGIGWGEWLRSLPKARSFAVLARDDLSPFCHGMTALGRRRMRRGWAVVRGRLGLGSTSTSLVRDPTRRVRSKAS